MRISSSGTGFTAARNRNAGVHSMHTSRLKLVPKNAPQSGLLRATSGRARG